LFDIIKTNPAPARDVATVERLIREKNTYIAQQL
jgi:hypothetical protein